MKLESVTLAKVSPAGVSSHVWSAVRHEVKDTDELISKALQWNVVTEPGVYLVCWNVIDKVPFARVYTVYEDDEGVLRYRGGFPTQERVTRWPPPSLRNA